PHPLPGIPVLPRVGWGLVSHLLTGGHKARRYARLGVLCTGKYANHRKLPTLLIIMLIAFACSFAQAADKHSDLQERARYGQIKADSAAYLWGEGTDSTRERARQVADADLLSRIQTSIVVTYKDETREKKDSAGYVLIQDFVSKHSSFTALYIRGLDHVTYRKDGRYHVLSFATWESLEKSFARRRGQIEEYIALGKDAENENRIGDAIQNYYRAWLLSFTYPDTISVSFIGGPRGANPEVILRNKIKTTIDDIAIDSKKTFPDRNVVNARLEFSYYGKSVENLSFSYYDGFGTSLKNVNDGKVIIPFYDEPELAERSVTLSIQYTNENDTLGDKEMAGLYRVFGDRTMANTKQVHLKFKWFDEDTVPEPDAYPSTPAPVRYPTQLLMLRKAGNTQLFLDLLYQYEEMGELVNGNRVDFKNGGAGCYVAVLDEQSLRGIFHYDGKVYVEISSGRKMKTLSDEFSGKRVIWIKETL
ncbi:MAG: hypothetical protein U9R56_06325, partial [candidate division Zixibacteria bacterium]|nr:hypothetical protein [candidate division Zixibacteria bacterium]